jgi:Uncharacterized protein conserved in bacteria
MKKSSDFFEKLHHLYLTSGLWIAFSLIGSSTFLLPANPVALKVEGQIYPWETLKSLVNYHMPLEPNVNGFGKDKRTEVKVVYEDGREIQHDIIIEKVIKTNDKTGLITASVIPELKMIITTHGRYRYRQSKVMEATAYYPGPECTGKYAYYGRTYTGKKAGYGLIAVDPLVIPLGTKLYIEGYGYAEAADIGGLIKGDRIDLCYQTYQEAKNFGRKKTVVYILE